MRWSFRIARIAGIPIQCHVTFLLLVAWIAISGGLFTGQPRAALAAVVLLLVVFTCVVLHELGHALAARRYGIATRDITLLPIGGLARLERMPERPTQELVVALAGPAVNVALALAAGIAIQLRGLDRPFLQLLLQGAMLEGDLLVSVFVINVWMLLFNLIPAFPMDGGRVLRALLATRMPYARATRIASSVGQFLALVFGVVGVMTHYVLLLVIALFVFLAAGEERTQVQARVALQGLPVRDATLTEFRSLDAADPLRLAVRYLMAGSQTEFPVLASGRPLGVLTSPRLVEALSRLGPDASVGEASTRDETFVEASDPLDAALARVRASGLGAAPVLDQGKLVGLLTLDNVGELLLVRNAIKHFQGHAEA